jgi:hypothetical protein
VLEPHDELDPTFYIVEAKVMGLSDMLLGWLLPASAILLLLHHPFWPYLALIGSGVFIYFSMLIIFSRIYLKKSGRKVGSISSVRAAYIFGGIWITSSVAMIFLAISTLSS